MRVVKIVAASLGGLIAALCLVGVLFVNLSPQFGQGPTEEQMVQYAATGHYVAGQFINAEAFDLSFDCHGVMAMLEGMVFRPDPNLSPRQNIEVRKIDPATLLAKPAGMTRVTWFGHSSFLIELDGKNILIDPVFGQYAAPHPWLGRKRYNGEMPIEIGLLPLIDAVVISHDHYDHLDYPSIVQLNDKTSRFFVPLGIGNHLSYWGVPREKIVELDWWQESGFGSIDLICAPARHMSGRGLLDQSATLWSSWVIKGEEGSIYFSGDGGYGGHFAEIGARYGPFDLGLMECGQYNTLWPDVHMMPEETVQAALDAGIGLVVPIHWGSFTLAMHSWTDPIERVTASANEAGLPIATPRIGEPVVLGDADYPRGRWWEGVAGGGQDPVLTAGVYARPTRGRHR